MLIFRFLLRHNRYAIMYLFLNQALFYFTEKLQCNVLLDPIKFTPSLTIPYRIRMSEMSNQVISRIPVFYTHMVISYQP